MTTLYHEIEVMTSPNRAWNLLTTRQGLARWWPGEIQIHGGDSWCFLQADRDMELIFRVVEEEPEKLLEWLCTQGGDEFPNTLIHWRIEKQNPGVSIVLEHRDLRLPPPQLAKLNTLWGTWMERIREQLHQEIETLDDDDLNAWT